MMEAPSTGAGGPSGGECPLALVILLVVTVY